MFLRLTYWSGGWGLVYWDWGEGEGWGGGSWKDCAAAPCNSHWFRVYSRQMCEGALKSEDPCQSTHTQVQMQYIYIHEREMNMH